MLHFTTQTAAVSDPQRESVIALLTRLNDPVAAEPGTRLLSAVTPVLAWTVDSALPPVLYLARVAAPVSIFLIRIIAVLSVGSFHFPVPAEQPGLSRVLGVDALLAVDADPAELDLAEIVAAVAADNVAVVADFILQGLIDSVSAVRSHHFGRTRGRRAHLVAALPAGIDLAVFAALLVPVVALLVVAGLEDAIPANSRVHWFLGTV